MTTTNRPDPPTPPSKDGQFIVLNGQRLPAPTGMDCLVHPSWPTVWKGGEAFCRRGQHYPWSSSR
jgi:hypothetical protein